MVMDSDIETVLSRQVRDEAAAHFQIFPPMEGRERCHYSPLIGHLSWPHTSIQNSPKR